MNSVVLIIRCKFVGDDEFLDASGSNLHAQLTGLLGLKYLVFFCNYINVPKRFQ